MSNATPTLGLHLEPLGVELARHEADGVVAFAGKDRLPPAALLPRLPGEPERGDVEWPPHRRGSGFGGGETEIAGPRDAGRYPLAHAWADLAAGSTEQWRWSRSAAADATLSPARALAACLRAASPREEDRPVGLVLPEACDTFAQQALLDAAGQFGRKPLLVWRSVAAASAWLGQHADDRLPHAAEPGDEAGDLLCVHAGLDAVEVSRVRVVAVEDPDEPEGFSWVPGRSGRGHGSGLGLRPAWEAAAGADDHAAPAGSPWCRAVGGAAPGRLATGRPWRTGLERELAAAAAEPGGQQVLGVVVTGPFAELEVDRLPLAVHAAAAVPRGPSLPACVVGRNEPVGLLAGSAAFLCDRVERGLVAWLDKLPDVRLLVRTADGEHGWARLLDEDDWVAGGRPWSRSEPLTGFSVASGAASLTLPIHHEAFETVREVKVEFEDLPTRHVAVKLEVEIRPGQGQASLRAQPEEPTGIDLLDNGVLADWAGMEDKHQRPAAYVEGLPRAYPPTEARRANPRLWNDAAAQARRVILAASPTPSEVRVLGSKLMDYPKGSGVTVAEMQTRATDSDGLPAFAAARADVEAMVEKLLGLLDPMPRRGSPRGDLVDAAVRALGYAAASDPGLEALLVRSVRGSTVVKPATAWKAAGQCVRSPEAFAELTRAACDAVERGEKPRMGRDPLEALARILQYRPDAAATLSAADGDRLARMTLDEFNDELDSGSGDFIFRNAACLLGYLLRLRIRHPSFLDPGDQATSDPDLELTRELASEIRHSFALALFRSKEFDAEGEEGPRYVQENEAAWHARCGADSFRLMGGQIDLPAALCQLLDYVNGRGTGMLVMHG